MRVAEHPTASDDSQLRQTACPVCSGSTEDFFHLPRLPIDVGVVHPSAEAARQAATGEVTLASCRACGFVFNRSFRPERLRLTPGYEVQLVHSAVFREFLQQQASRLIEKYDLHGKRLIDIGCGAGHFLRLLCELGSNSGLGIDPTVSSEDLLRLAAGEIRLLRRQFGGDVARSIGDFDFAICQSVLENVADPVAFLSDIRRAIARRQGRAYLEVFNAGRAFAAGEVWSITYEQCNSFSLDSFTHAIRRAGFAILDSGLCYGEGQYLYVEALPAAEPCNEKPQRLQRHSAADGFAQSHRERLDWWRQQTEALRKQGRTAAVWGTGGKGICFLNTVAAPDVFVWAVDINPNRQNRYVPGSGQPILSPAQLAFLRPDAIVITNPLYESEIRRAVTELHLNCEFLTI